MKRKIKTGFTIILCLILLTGLCLYLGRDSLLKNIIQKEIEKAEQSYHLKIDYGQIHMPQLNKIELHQLSIIPANGDTLLTLDSLQINLNFYKMLKLDIKIDQVNTNGIQINLVKKDSISNYDFLFKKEREILETFNETKTDYANRISGTLDLIFSVLPDNGKIDNFKLIYRNDSSSIQLNIPMIHIKNNYFNTEIVIQEDSINKHWIAEGLLMEKEKTMEAKVYPKGKNKTLLPYFSKRYNAQIAFDTLTYRFTESKLNRNKIQLSGKAEISGLSIFQQKISPETINLRHGTFSYCLNIGTNFIELDSTSQIRFNQLKFHPYLYAEKQGAWHVTGSTHIPYFPSDDLFSSLPKGLFTNLEGIKTSGDLAYHFLIDIDFNQLDSLKLESEMATKDFKITDFGRTKLNKMNEDFIYTAYEHEKPVREFVVGSSNPNFRPLDSISPTLRMAILQSEDGSFFHHKGFRLNALKEALIHDLKVGRFARGGSTITMQLVKNVFLNRNKNIARKLEEAIIVWLIESQKLTSKERMYEVYLNIIEWGPMIYGAKEASEYYFKKEPIDLTTNEAIYMASIIPKPKRFRESFDDNLQLKQSMEGYYRIIGKRLESKDIISETELEQVCPAIEIVGEAKRDFDLSKDSMRTILIERVDKKWQDAYRKEILQKH